MGRFEVRNFLGAALGGVFGILMWGFVHPVSCVVGCFAGAVLGYHYEFIGTALNAEFAFGKIKRMSKLLGEARMLLQNFALTSRRTQIVLARVMTSALFIIVFIAQFMLAVWLNAYLGIEWFTAIAVPWVIIALLSTIVTLMQIGVERWDYSASAGSAEEWAVWNMPIRQYLITNTRDIARLLFVWLVMLTLLITWLVIAGALFTVFVLCPIAVVWAVMGILYQATVRGGHWSSFAVSLVVTLFAGLYMHPSFSDPRVIWLTALATGIVSGIVAEVCRLVLVQIISRFAFIRRMSEMDLSVATQKARSFFGTATKTFCDVVFSDARIQKVVPAWA